MNAKIILYFVVCLIVIWGLDGVRLNEIFKQNRVMQSRIMYIIITLSLSYLVVNFLYDFLRL